MAQNAPKMQENSIKWLFSSQIWYGYVLWGKKSDYDVKAANKLNLRHFCDVTGH